MIDEVNPSYRMAGLLVGLTAHGKLIIEFERSRQVVLRPHQVDLKDLPNPSHTDMTWQALDPLSE